MVAMALREPVHLGAELRLSCGVGLRRAMAEQDQFEAAA
jgi:hypothetical protein